jgi:hypothetical protein
MNFFKLKSDDNWEVTGEMYPLFQDLVAYPGENLLKLLVLKHE